MDAQDAINLTQQAMLTALLLGTPILLAGVLVGLIIGLAQALTQVQDQTMACVPRIVAMVAALTLTQLFCAQPIPHPENLLILGTLLAREAILGLALGLAVLILLSEMQLAGQIISQTSGLSLAEVANPTFDTTVPLFTQILEM